MINIYKITGEEYKNLGPVFKLQLFPECLQNIQVKQCGRIRTNFSAFTYSIPYFLEKACKGKADLYIALSSCNSQIPKYLCHYTYN